MATERPPAPLTRAEQQENTRAALVASARRVFGRNGYHGAKLAAIAREAGLTKGAVYSNFASKADLFLAVLDEDLASLEPGSWDPFARFEAVPDIVGVSLRAPDLTDEGRVELGFGLTSLEFAASAARDPELSDALFQRLERLLEVFEAIARREHSDDDPIDVRQLSTLLMALDQGAAIFWLIGWTQYDSETMRRMVKRMLNPTSEETAET